MRLVHEHRDASKDMLFTLQQSYSSCRSDWTTEKSLEEKHSGKVLKKFLQRNMEAIDSSALNNIKPATSYTSQSLHEAVKLRIGKQGLAAIAPQSIPQFFRECCEKYADLPALMYEAREQPGRESTEASNKQRKTGSKSSNLQSTEVLTQWISVTYAEYDKNVQQAALVLLHVGLQPRSSVGVLAFNCPEWFYIEMGAFRAGGVIAGIYPSSSPEAVFHVLDTSEATVCIVDDSAQMAKVRAVRKRLPRLRAVLQLEGPYDDFVGNEEGYYRWDDMVQRQFGDDLREELNRQERDVGANECAMLIYTSGTLGMPKAAMMSHDTVISDARAISAALPKFDIGTEVAVSFLPLNHVAAQVFDVFLPLLTGSCVYFADRNALKGSLGRYFAIARPTRIFAVPRVFEKIQEKLLSIESKSSLISKYIMQMARRTMEQYHMQRLAGKTPSAIKYWLASKVTQQVKCALGFERCKSLLVGGAPASEALKRYFLSLDLRLHEIFGMTETGGATNIAEDACSLSSAGRPFEGTEQKIYNPNSEGHGEICMRGRTVFMGYLHNIEQTKETIMDDGWLHSGDIGYLDTDGCLHITGRIKELIITAGGENIPPIRIETLIKSELPGISNAMVVGDHKKYLTVLLTLKTELDDTTGQPTDILCSEVVHWFQSLGLDYKLLSQALNIPADNTAFDASNVVVKPHSKILESIEAGIKRANLNAISNAQRVQKFALLPHDFSIPTGELGPTLKVRRSIVHQKYANIIEGMYK